MITALSILGSTGSIGTQTLEVCRELNIQVTSISCGRNLALLKEQILEFHPKYVSVAKAEDATELSKWLDSVETKSANGASSDWQKPTVFYGEEGNRAVACDPDAELVVAAMVGMAGLKPVIAALESGHHVALANKETLVAGGDLVMDLAARREVELRPVDSEHSAIWQCLQGAAEPHKELDHILLTASGGPFRGKTADDLKTVTVSEALDHPTWQMGGKITIDSATLMNKGLELIEAMHLFQLREDQVQVVVHPESIVHSAVAYRDGAVLAQLGWPDMKLPIRLALTWPRRVAAEPKAWNPLSDGASSLHFEAPDTETFRCLALARQAARQGGDSPLILNAANEVAVAAFLKGQLSFLGIADLVEASLEKLSGRFTGAMLDIESILALDREVRSVANQLLKTS